MTDIEWNGEYQKLVAELEQQLADTTWQDHADYWQKRAVVAEQQLAECQAREKVLRYCKTCKGLTFEKLAKELWNDTKTGSIGLLKTPPKRHNNLGCFRSTRNFVCP